ncbi:hypothetical protein DQ240_23015 [Blastococcus sp. TF02A-26]|nr:hypothetical protein DQ240_23015 [Blastococcus sp. TF02A-26]
MSDAAGRSISPRMRFARERRGNGGAGQNCLLRDDQDVPEEATEHAGGRAPGEALDRRVGQQDAFLAVQTEISVSVVSTRAFDSSAAEGRTASSRTATAPPPVSHLLGRVPMTPAGQSDGARDLLSIGMERCATEGAAGALPPWGEGRSREAAETASGQRTLTGPTSCTGIGVTVSARDRRRTEKSRGRFPGFASLGRT